MTDALVRDVIEIAIDLTCASKALDRQDALSLLYSARKGLLDLIAEVEALNRKEPPQ